MAPGVDGGSGLGVQSAAFELTGLQVYTAYHYRIVASNSKGTTIGADQSFETIGARIFSFASLPSTDQAGSHPDIDTSFHFSNRVNRLGGEGESEEPSENECGCQDPVRIKVSAPAGVIANPHATPQCTRVAFGVNECPPSTQMGWVEVGLPANHIIAAALQSGN